MPGALCLDGPTKEKGLTLFDQTGSVRMLKPCTWIKRLAWPIIVTLRRSASMLGSGFAC
ncbi:hypothetical protein D3C85_1829300 [compost metagenome]